MNESSTLNKWSVDKTTSFDKSLRKFLSKNKDNNVRKRVLDFLKNSDEGFKMGIMPKGSHPVETSRYGSIYETHVANIGDVLLYFNRHKKTKVFELIAISNHNLL